MNGSPSHPAWKRERGTTAAEICDLRGDEGIALLARAIANRPPNEGRLRGLAWR
ncbi:MAG TPA: hypothetical protein HA263_03130 [Methanoregulaceae archaeon]|nr:hypothetical protein [Methanoregulaceae archaeon]